MDRVARFCADAQCPQPDKEVHTCPHRGVGKNAGQAAGHVCPRGAGRIMASILLGPVWKAGGRGGQCGC